ncbi:MAG: hypothetical protein IJC20_00445 [Clostridia bacterium]|nr:hypothetical protein [Clostridia bacterium]
MSDSNRNLPTNQKTSAVATRRIQTKKSKREMYVRLAKRFFAQFGTAIIAVAIVAYVFLQLMLNVSVNLDRETATYASITDRAELEAFVFRDEFLIESSLSGTNCCLAEDGEKVRYGENIVVTYSDPKDVETQAKISEIDKRIDILERSSLSIGASTTDIELIDEEIDKLVLSMIRQVDANDFDKVIRQKEELLILMNRRQSLIQHESFASELSSLHQQREALLDQLTGASYITESPKSGYFYSTVDGYENEFTLERLENLTAQEFETLGKTVPDNNILSNSVGKIALSSTWYIAVALDKRTAETFKDGVYYPITFQYSNNIELDMKLERRITRTDKDVTVLVFSTKKKPEGFDYSRKQTVELPIATHEGIRVNNSAIRMKDGVTGVYAVVGSKIVFKKTEVLYNYGSYCICAIPTNPAYPERKDIAYSSKTELSLHDSVVIDGEDIYDGMRLK